MKRLNPAIGPTIWCIAWFLAAATLPAATHTAKLVPKTILLTISDDELKPLPRQSMAAPATDASGSLGFPAELYRIPAEYEPEAGIIVRWGSFNDVLTQIIVGVTTGDDKARAFVVVSGDAQQGRAEKILSVAGAVMDRVRFIHYRADSPWMRDYGPRFLAQASDDYSSIDGRAETQFGSDPVQKLNGSRENNLFLNDEPDTQVVLDYTYNRFRLRDNLFTSFLSTLWGHPRLSVPLKHAGGNFHVFSNGEAFATERIEDDNPGLKRWRLIAWFLSIAGLDLTVYPSFPVDFDQSGHIDMWMLPVSDHRIIVGQYPAESGLPHEITERAVSELSSRGYRVYRTPGWHSKGTHYTYTNALIFNTLVFVPVFERYRKNNRVALEAFEDAFPYKQLIPVDCSRPIASSGAIHCLVIHIPKNP